MLLMYKGGGVSKIRTVRGLAVPIDATCKSSEPALEFSFFGVRGKLRCGDNSRENRALLSEGRFGVFTYCPLLLGWFLVAGREPATAEKSKIAHSGISAINTGPPTSAKIPNPGRVPSILNVCTEPDSLTASLMTVTPSAPNLLRLSVTCKFARCAIVISVICFSPAANAFAPGSPI